MTEKNINQLEDLFISQITKMEELREKLTENAHKLKAIDDKIAANPDNKELEAQYKSLKAEEKTMWYEILDGVGRDAQNTRDEIIEHYDENGDDGYEVWLDNIDKKCPGMEDRYYEMREFMEDVWNIIMIQMWKDKFGDI